MDRWFLLFDYLYQKLTLLELFEKNFQYYLNLIKIFYKTYLNNFLNKKIFKKMKPDLIFYLASNADVRSSFDHPEIIQNNNNCTLNLLEACRINGVKLNCNQ